MEVAGDGSGKDAFRGHIGGARQAAEPVVFEEFVRTDYRGLSGSSAPQAGDERGTLVP